MIATVVLPYPQEPPRGAYHSRGMRLTERGTEGLSRGENQVGMLLFSYL